MVLFSLREKIMVINKTAYPLDENHYFGEVHEKQVISLGNTWSMDMDHWVGWKSRLNGKNKRTAPYTIDIDGNIYEHFNPKYYSKFLNHEAIDRHIIPILIENEGYLVKDLDSETYRNYMGRIYKREGEIVNRRWRNHTYWAPYNKEQLDSVVELIKHLRKEFSIRGLVMGHNTKYDNIYSVSGVTYKSNYNEYYNDVTPAWDFEIFKNKLENRYE